MLRRHDPAPYRTRAPAGGVDAKVEPSYPVSSGSPKRLHELLIFNTRVVFSPSFHHQAQHNKI